MLAQAQVNGFEIAKESLSLASGLLLMLGLVGPYITQRVIIWANEAKLSEEK